MTLDHVDVVARLATGTSAPVRAAIGTPSGQAELLTLARRVDAGAFAKSAARWAARVDQSGLERSRQAQRAARFLTLSSSGAGVRIAGLLDTDAGHRLQLALEAVAGKPGPDDDRSPEQRRADALESMATATLATPPTSTDGPTGRRPHVSIVMTPQTWAELRNAAQRDRGDAGSASAGAGAGAAATMPAPVGDPAVLDDGLPVAPSDLARTLCDCELSRVVIGADGEPVDLGRTVRTHTPAQRRAITARDRGCAWPGCGTPSRWCEVHHLVWWDRDGGDTSVLDGALLCSFHHHEVHRLDLVVTRFTVGHGGGEGGRSATYTVVTPGGRIVADGRVRGPDGAPAGDALRTWTPGRGASKAAPPGIIAVLGAGPMPRRAGGSTGGASSASSASSAPGDFGRGARSGPPVRPPERQGALPMSDPTGRLGPWTSS